jgi:hypothetical protein
MPTSPPRNNRTVPTPWYRVPLLWFAIVLFIVILAACVHLILISSDGGHALGPDGASQSFRGVPLVRDGATPDDATPPAESP